MLKKMLKNQRGLTLIELLAVIVILGIIAAIAVPSIGNIIENSRDKATVSEAIQIIDAAKIARAENPENNTYDETSLAPYLDKVKEGEYDVVYNEGFTISNHEACSIVGDAQTDSISEEELIDFIDGN
ncbi:type IV pilin protein [Metabacillus bambusae]|uniref:Type II secretion system protein n=1 Tax=Metabacillus bambusae TaxID=2795218 RepID=A0ABS3N972_9BACI|nr:type II secretion system protein [Metabacillus bambusae]MBO1514758.1 type II secretion system protein [Metabacillus bambusae]